MTQFIGSNHFKYILTQEDFQKNFSSFLHAIDEPYADSSAFAVYLLSKYVKEDVTVALSGDGADEVFGGYRKHFADFKIRKMKGSKKALLKLTAAGLKSFRSNRSDRWGELNRKVQKLNKGLLLDHQSRYIKWCQFIEEDGREKLLLHNFESIAPSFNDFETKLCGGQHEKHEGDSLFIPLQYGLEPQIIDVLERNVNFSNDRKALKAIRRIILEYKPDVVHTHASKAGALGRYAAYKEKVPVIVHTFYGHVFHSYFGKLKTVLIRGLNGFWPKSLTQ